MEYLIGTFAGAVLGFYAGMLVMNRYWIDTDKISEWRRRALHKACERLESGDNRGVNADTLYAELIAETNPYGTNEQALFRAKFD